MRNENVGQAFALVAVLGCLAQGCTLTSPNDGVGGMGSYSGSSGTGAAAGSNTGPSGACMMTAPVAVPAPPAPGATKQPCDIYAEDGGPCVAAHSTVRALYSSYSGPLYQVRKGEMTKDIAPITPGGYANAADQDTFCGPEACTISIIYDQSGWNNHLTKSPPGGAKPTPGNEANAKSIPGTFHGNNVYGVHVAQGVGYRNNAACGTATGDASETMYMIVAADYYNNGCCFDYGNMERNSRDNGEGTMEAVYYGKCTTWGKGAGEGPWVMGDLENGLWAGDHSPYLENPPITGMRYVTGLVKGAQDKWAIKTGNAESGPLFEAFKPGPRPGPRYKVMRKEGAIGLGTGGDNSNAGIGNFFEGLMTAHYSTDAADDAVQASIVATYAP